MVGDEKKSTPASGGLMTNHLCRNCGKVWLGDEQDTSLECPECVDLKVDDYLAALRKE